MLFQIRSDVHTEPPVQLTVGKSVPVRAPADLQHLYLLVPVGCACVGEQRGDKHRLCCCCCQETRCKAAQLRTAETINSSAAQSFTGTTHHITHVAEQQHRAKQHHCILYYDWIRAEVSLLNVDVKRYQETDRGENKYWTLAGYREMFWWRDMLSMFSQSGVIWVTSYNAHWF